MQLHHFAVNHRCYSFLPDWHREIRNLTAQQTELTKSTPIVERCTSLNRSSTNRVIRQLLPTEESPTNTILNVWSLEHKREEKRRETERWTSAANSVSLFADTRSNCDWNRRVGTMSWIDKKSNLCWWERSLLASHCWMTIHQRQAFYLTLLEHCKSARWRWDQIELSTNPCNECSKLPSKSGRDHFIDSRLRTHRSDAAWLLSPAKM